MRGENSVASVIILIFVHVGQINTSTIPHKISMAKIDTSGLNAAINRAVTPDTFDIYSNNASTPLQAENGIRKFYDFGLYSYCAYIDEKAGSCGNQTIGERFKPYDVIAADARPDIKIFVTIISTAPKSQGDTFFDSRYLGQSSKAAYWMILIGTICAMLALITGLLKNNLTYFLSTIFAVLSSLLLLIAASIWTVIIKKAQGINTLVLPGYDALGITLSIGPGVFLTWAAFVCMLVAVVPYGISTSNLILSSLFRQDMPLGLSGVVTLFTAFLASTVHAIPKVTRTGRYLYDDSGKRFYIKGIAYQEQGEVIAGPDNDFLEPSTFIDPLALGDACRRDLPFLQELGVNTLRVYSVDSSLNHDDCMSTFSNAGIYVIIDLALPLNGSIDRLSPSWSTNLLNQYTTTIDVFSKYDNVLAYNVGNEVVVQESTSVAPFVKAAARDVKAYLKSKKSDALVGYAAINGASDWREPLANYLSCDPDGKNSDSTAIDLYGLNNYEWCGASTFQTSYARTTDAFERYNVVAYFSEFGCILSPPRLWTETQALFSSDMARVWSGGIAFSYFPAQSAQGQFGMVTISADNTTVTTSDDFDRLKAQYSQVTFIDSPSPSAAGSTSYPSCAPSTSAFLVSNKLPQTPNNAACDCLKNSLSCHFTPQTSNYTAIAGELIDFGCSLLGQSGGSCQDIGGDGRTGVYGRISDCDPTIKLSYVMSQYYEANGRNVDACSFAGNGTVNGAVSATGTSAAISAASSCVASPGATFVPSPAPSPPASSGSNNNTGNGGKTGGAVRHFESDAFVGICIMTITTALGAFWTLS
ncbi:hypothetical protein CVT24_005003 [Panaeolus cyanescens]|uniref:1,3-beta-glucanosyltransferase n=1 Tax=Panaeolus cyanescens TaxID=181874 RepID=A0A409YB61_9AGAR|nr:hypothetical protein CVT24_005003 [Panaeolus cyanescens]